jgi:pimeloyl-ACP methyl ester carboxylesterase
VLLVHGGVQGGIGGGPANYAGQKPLSARGAGADGGANPSAAALENHPERAMALGCALLQAQSASPAAMRQAAEIVVKAHIPVLVISGGYNGGQDATSEVVARLLHGRHVNVRSPNHFVQQSNPEEFNRTVDAFMRETDNSRASP